MSSNLHWAVLPHNRPIVDCNVGSQNAALRELLSIPDITYKLLSELTVVPLTVNDVLYEQGDHIEFVYFPLDSVISGIAITTDGTAMETSMVGRDGLAGISALLNTDICRQWIWVTIGGSAIKVETKLIGKLLIHHETALKSFLRYYRSLITQVAQRCVCNTRHTIMERLCCWLLMIDDRVGPGNLKLTQEMIASRIGVRRAGITVAAGSLQEMNAIDYRRGQLNIRSRKILEQMVCECYTLIAVPFEPNNQVATPANANQVTG